MFASANRILGLDAHGFGSRLGPTAALAVALCGMGLAWYMYVRKPLLPYTVAKRLGGLYTVAWNKFYIDEFYAATVVRLTVDGSRWVWRNFDEKIIDGAVHGTAWLWQRAGRVVRPLQTGKVQHYLLGILTVVRNSDGGGFPVTLTALTFLPTVGALVMLIFMRGRPNAYKTTALVTSIATLALAVWVAARFKTGELGSSSWRTLPGSPAGSPTTWA